MYLQKVVDKELPVNHAILGNLQDVFNLLPNLGVGPPGETSAGGNIELARAMSVKTNDQLMAIYLSSLVRAITAFHDLIENKIQNKQHHEHKDGGENTEKNAEKEKEKEKEKSKDGKDKEKKVNGINGEPAPKDTDNSTTQGKKKDSRK